MVQLNAAKLQLRISHEHPFTLELIDNVENMGDRSWNDTSLALLNVKGHRHILRVLLGHDSLHGESLSSSCLTISKNGDFMAVDDRPYDSFNLLEHTLLR